MKNFISILAILIAFSSCNGGEENKLKRYDIESGEVEYKITISGNVLGSTINGSGIEKLYFKEWGAVELLEEESSQTTVTSVFGKKNTETTNTHTMTKLDDGESYHVNFDKEQILVRRDLAMDMTKEFHADADAGEVGKSMLESMGGKVVGNEKFLGYNCEIWDIMGAKQWMYKGVVLKMEVSVMGVKTIKEAVSAKFNSKVADKYFALPDYPIVEEEGFLDNEEYEEEQQEMDAKAQELSKMSFEEWKKIATANDPEMQAKSDAELRQTYDMIQKMLKMRNSK